MGPEASLHQLTGGCVVWGLLGAETLKEAPLSAHVEVWNTC